MAQYENKLKKLGSYEKQYMKVLTDVYEKGYSDGVNKRTGLSTKRLPGIVFRVDVEKEFPILISKKVPAKTAHREIDWIWVQHSNKISDLKAKIWDEWKAEDGTLKKAYGYQAAKPVDIYVDTLNKTEQSHRHYNNQLEFVVEYLREFPAGRWAVMTLWSVEQLNDMQLVPCCHTSTWNLDGGRLNCVLDQRSGDLPYGVPFNTTQYAELMIIIANDLGVKPGILTHVIADAHIYENQMPGVELQIANHNLLKALAIRTEHMALINSCIDKVAELEYRNLNRKHECSVDSYKSNASIRQIIVDKANKALLCRPKFVINSDKTSVFDITPDDCKVDNYDNMGEIYFGKIAV